MVIAVSISITLRTISDILLTIPIIIWEMPYQPVNLAIFSLIISRLVLPACPAAFIFAFKLLASLLNACVSFVVAVVLSRSSLAFAMILSISLLYFLTASELSLLYISMLDTILSASCLAFELSWAIFALLFSISNSDLTFDNLLRYIIKSSEEKALSSNVCNSLTDAFIESKPV